MRAFIIASKWIAVPSKLISILCVGPHHFQSVCKNDSVSTVSRGQQRRHAFKFKCISHQPFVPFSAFRNPNLNFYNNNRPLSISVCVCRVMSRSGEKCTQFFSHLHLLGLFWAICSVHSFDGPRALIFAYFCEFAHPKKIDFMQIGHHHDWEIRVPTDCGRNYCYYWLSILWYGVSDRWNPCSPLRSSIDKLIESWQNRKSTWISV